MEGLVGLIFSKAGAALAGALAILALWLRGAWHKRRAERAEAAAAGLEVKVHHQETVTNIDQETERAKDELEAAVKEPDGLTAYFRNGKLMRGNTEGSDS
jgi:hypothetical protein